MIEPSELRIGNLIQDSEGVIVKVVSIRDDSIGTDHDYYHDISLLSGITLTEDWLKRMGFKNVTEHYHEYYRFQKDGRMLINRDGAFVDYASRMALKCVHEIQNFWHAVTGTELTIEL